MRNFLTSFILGVILCSPSYAEHEKKITAGVKILLDGQENWDKTDGHTEWPYEGVYRVRGEGGRAVIPHGYRIGGTAICGWSLIEAPGYQKDEASKKAISESVDFLLHALEDKRMTADFRDGYDVRGWGHAYALTFFARLKELDLVPAAKKKEVDASITSLVKILQESEIQNTGGWNYSRRGGQPQASTFMTASTLQALMAAKGIGEKTDPKVIDRALKTLESSRLESGAYQYSLSDRKTGKGFEHVAGATGRMPICEVTLYLNGKGSIERVEQSVEAFFEHWEWLEKRRQGTGTHIPPYMIAPYYFFYAHYYTAQAIELLPEEKRKPHRERFLKLLFKVQEENGAWNDRVFERSQNYGTAMAMLAILEPEAKSTRKWMKKK